MVLAWSDRLLPAPGDVVWCRFPYDERPNHPAPSGHPALVFQVVQQNSGTFSVQVAFGTSNITRAPHHLNLVIHNMRSLDHAGLQRATLFDLGRVRFLPWTSDWFHAIGRNKTPIMGGLDIETLGRLRQILAARQNQGLAVPVPRSRNPRENT